ncbi:MAG: AAA family ATPase [Anaerolineae bacterium]|nr:AAA family ATPase [Anaerolineae bacterium]
MRLISLHIDRYQMLRDLTIRFDRPGRLKMGAYALDFLVGLNGSGKSTLLRVLAQIVTDLHANRPTAFNYRLEYELQQAGQRLRVQVIRQRPHLTMTVYNPNDGPAILDNGAVDATFLPERIVVYTTGNLAAWDELDKQSSTPADEHNAAADILSDPIKRSVFEIPGLLPRPDVPENSDEIQSPLLLLRSSRLPIITLTGLLASLQSETPPLNEVLTSLGLVGLRGFSLRLRLHQALSDYELFHHLRLHATRHIQQGSDHLLVFELPAERTAQRTFTETLWSDYATPLDFFDALNQLCEPLTTGEPTLQQVNIFLERELIAEEEEDGATRLLLFDWMSDGEQSFLSRMAMLAMLQTENSLILLDEPEVHFNDYWKREIVKLIDTVMHNHANHLLIVSHSSIGLSDVASAQVTVMSKGANGFAVTHPPTIKTLGTDPSEIMMIVFRTGLSTGAYATQLLESAVQSGEREEIAHFLETVGPGMWLFRLQRRLEDFDASPIEPT